jgi:hypothetical protein
MARALIPESGGTGRNRPPQTRSIVRMQYLGVSLGDSEVSRISLRKGTKTKVSRVQHSAFSPQHSAQSLELWLAEKVVSRTGAFPQGVADLAYAYLG